MLFNLNVIYSKIFGKNKLYFVIEKIKQYVLNFRVKTFDNITAIIIFKYINHK
jgi:hypothetical protein